MKYFSIMIVLLVSSLFAGRGYCQDVAIKTNLLYGAATFTPNLSVETGLGEHTTLDVSIRYNWLNIDGTKNNNKKLLHWIVLPELRYFLCKRFNGHFFGFHALYSQYNIGGHELPMLFGKGSKDFRHKGDAYGAGVSYGYQFILGEKWNLELNAGVGYIRLQYDKYECETCGKYVSKDTKNYYGPTKAGITLIYLIN